MTDLIKNDPILGSNFFLEIDGSLVSHLSEVNGLDLEVNVAELQQVGDKGMMQVIKSLGQHKAPGDITMKRVAPLDIENDAVWKWFQDIYNKGMGAKTRDGSRKNGSVVIFDATNTEVARWNFYNAWPSKISNDGFNVTSNDPVMETITLVCERLERKK